MNRLCFLSLILIYLPTWLSAQDTVIIPPRISLREANESSVAHILHDEGEEFIIDGSRGFRAFVRANAMVFDSVKKGIVRGYVYIRVTTDTNGVTLKYFITQGIFNCEQCSHEALRIVKLIPRWRPLCFYEDDDTKKKIKCVPRRFLVKVPFPYDYDSE